MNKKITIIVGIVALSVIMLGFIVYRNNTAPDNVSNNLLGGDRDEHGCIGSAGYSWCEAKQKCLRIWEEKCETISTDEISDWRIYENTKFGFELKFPETWEGCVVTEGDYPDYSQVAFSFRDGRQPFIIINIIRYSKEQWGKLNGVLGSMKVLDQTADTTLVCDGCCDEAGDFTGGGQFDKFQIERCQEAPQIIKTFQVKRELVCFKANQPALVRHA